MNENEIINIDYIKYKTTLIPEIMKYDSFVENIIKNGFDEDTYIRNICKPVNILSDKAWEELIYLCKAGLIHTEATHYFSQEDESIVIVTLYIYNASFYYLSKFDEDIIDKNSDNIKVCFSESLWMKIFNKFIEEQIEFNFDTCKPANWEWLDEEDNDND